MSEQNKLQVKVERAPSSRLNQSLKATNAGVNSVCLRCVQEEAGASKF